MTETNNLKLDKQPEKMHGIITPNQIFFGIIPAVALLS